ncbi:MAG TPA: hypothetical protein ENJ56_07515 [Anaerolineae bacterium]|nr:hypothetical protein [Anaerolineae bacterium]
MEIPDIPLSEEGDRFQLMMAVMIAIVTLSGALLAWRASVASANAGDADFAGMQAVLDAEQTLTINDIDLYRHYRAYTHYTYQQAIGREFPDATLTASNLAATNQIFFPTRYLNRDGSYAVQRQLGELWAQAAQINDLDPEPYFDQADVLRNKTNLLVASFILLTLSLFFYTMAESIHPDRPRLRYLLGGLGTLLLIGTIVMGVYVERTL